MTNAEKRYFQPVPCPAGQEAARALAGGLFGYREVAVRRRGGTPEIVPADAPRAMYPESVEVLERAEAPRADLMGLGLDRPRIMGVVNVTPDSFSDGGRYDDRVAAVTHALALVDAGAEILDIGGESTRPGSDPVPADQELDRVIPVIDMLGGTGCTVPISIDTRKARVAEAALASGARMINDVSALTHDPEMAAVAAGAEALCLMHAQGDPKTMQESPVYEDVLLDVYDHLEARIEAACAAGIARARILVDPGIGFGKTLAHNLDLLRGLALFHGLGCPILLGVSRKGFIGRLGDQPDAARRVPGSIAAGLHGLAAGAQILRVHDVAETRQAVRVWQAIHEGGA